jgi:hypothetical protein
VRRVSFPLPSTPPGRSDAWVQRIKCSIVTAHSQALATTTTLTVAHLAAVQVVYKKLLGQTPTFADLCDLSPQLGRGLQQLLDFQGDVEATFCRSFEARHAPLRLPVLLPSCPLPLHHAIIEATPALRSECRTWVNRSCSRLLSHTTAAT